VQYLLLARFEERGQGCGGGVDRLLEESVEEQAAAGWPLSYERPVSGLIWVWRAGKNCHPNPIG
jgi:hypothetical protein